MDGAVEAEEEIEPSGVGLLSFFGIEKRRTKMRKRSISYVVRAASS